MDTQLEDTLRRLGSTHTYAGTHTNPRSLITLRRWHHGNPQICRCQAGPDTSLSPGYSPCSSTKRAVEALARLPGAHPHAQETHRHKTHSYRYISRDMSREHSLIRPVAFAKGNQRPTNWGPQTHAHTPTHMQRGCDISSTRKHRKSWSLSSGVNVYKLSISQAAGKSEEYGRGLTTCNLLVWQVTKSGETAPKAHRPLMPCTWAWAQWAERNGAIVRPAHRRSTARATPF